MSESKKDKAPKKEKAKAPKAKEYLVVRYEALKADTEKGKKLLALETQSALIYRAVTKAKEPPTFVEIIAAISPALKGNSEATVVNNCRWYINELKKTGLLKQIEDKVEAASREAAHRVE